MPRRLPAVLVVICCVSLLSAQVRPTGVRITEPAMRNMRITKVNPDYPPLALQAHVEGTVRLQVRVTKVGDVDRVQVVSGHPMLALAAIEAVKQWKYKPYLLNGEPMQVETIVQLTFTLPNEHEGTATVTDSPLAPAPPANGLPNILRANPETIGVVGDLPGGIPSTDSNTATASPVSATWNAPARPRLLRRRPGTVDLQNESRLSARCQRSASPGHRHSESQPRQRRQSRPNRADQRPPAPRARCHRRRQTMEVQAVLAERNAGRGRDSGAGEFHSHGIARA